MNAIGIDVSKGKSMVAIMRPFGEVVASPVEVVHTVSGLNEFVASLSRLDGETKVIMEYTGNYYHPIANALREAGLFVSIIHAKLIHGYSNNSIRKVKTDKADAVKIANYGLDNWLTLTEYVPLDDIRRLLKAFCRQYDKYTKLKTMLKNNYIALSDQVFPGVNELFSYHIRKGNGHEKWLDFSLKFWHCDCIKTLSRKAFSERYCKWCAKEGYHFKSDKAEAIYNYTNSCCPLLPKNDTTKLLITQSINQIHAVSETLAVIAGEMKRLAELLPEYSIVSAFFGVGDILGPQLMAEIGDVRRFKKKGSLVCFAGLEAPPYQSGKFESENRSISKKGSPLLRKALFQLMYVYLRLKPEDEPVYQFIDRKRSEGKHYYSYMTAGSAKFLRIYYARVKEYLNAIDCKTELSS